VVIKQKRTNSVLVHNQIVAQDKNTSSLVAALELHWKTWKRVFALSNYA
jgi:hypothetical protein